jgi:hypothetical protein
MRRGGNRLSTLLTIASSDTVVMQSSTKFPNTAFTSSVGSSDEKLESCLYTIRISRMCVFAVAVAASADLETLGGHVEGNGRKIERNEHGDFVMDVSRVMTAGYQGIYNAIVGMKRNVPAAGSRGRRV